MKSAKQLISAVVLREGLKYIDKNPMENLNNLLDWADKIAVMEDHKNALKKLRKICSEPQSNWYKLIERFFTELNPKVREKFIVNFFTNSSMVGVPYKEKLEKKYNTRIPWAILMDPTSACNLNCKGCWAAEYDKVSSLDNNTLERIIEEGKELGIYMYIFSGGEPLIRKNDLISIAEKHDDCMFLAFTNGTLVDESFAKELARVGNFALAISIEGFEEETDMRRGKGTYKKVMEAMDILKKEGIIFGFSTCYHSKNTEIIGSEEYIDLMVKKGCTFGWYFTYIPIGKHAVVDLLATTEQREYMYHRVRQFREEKPIFILDFWNDGEYVEGCIAGGRSYIHINANGDVEPCAFIHYSNVNIKNTSLIDALKCQLFRQYEQNQPFNQNHLRPCPLLDNPEKLREMVHKSNARSTQPIDKESVDELTEKCQEISRKWSIVADRLWKDSRGQ